MMATKYAVYDPTTGENTQVDTKEDAMQLFWMRMISLAKPYFHDTAYMTVEVNDETGTETWYNDVGNIVDRPKTAAEIGALLETQTMMTKFGAPDGSSS